MVIVLGGERPTSTNVFYSSAHWLFRNQETERVKWIMREQIDPAAAQIFTCPVDIIFRVYFKGQMQDSGNISTKPYIDSLIDWYIEDDTPKYVHWVSTRSFKDNKNPRVEIEIVEAEL